MSLAAGTRLGIYEIVSPIGKGGMGEVYRARDTKLGREVAIKVLSEEFARDAERLERFEREARLLARFNHPNIATLYGLEEHEGQQFLAMELVEGETLAERIGQGRLPMDEAIPLFMQIAEGLEAAHEKGILHRDLKPANIVVGPDGKPKILDFGLAKAFIVDTEAAPVSSQSPTLTNGTALGAIMGTASYMSPEQARGVAVDKRTDVWAFGCCLYEALTAKKAFSGETVTDILAAVVKSVPDWNQLPSNTPSNVRRVLRRSLERDRRRRSRDMGDLVLDLNETPTEPSTTSEPPRTTRWRTVVPAVLLFVAASYVLASWRAAPSVETAWIGERLGGPTVAGFPVVSPDNTLVAFLVQDRGLTQVAVMQPGRAGGSRQLTHDRSRGYAGPPAWSADSSRIYFDRTGFTGSDVYYISGVGDSEERLVLEDATDPRPLPDGTLLAVQEDSDGVRRLLRYHPASNNLERLPVLLVSGKLFDPAIKIVPGALAAVVAGRPDGAPASENHLYLVDLETRGMRRIAPGVSLPFVYWEFPLSVRGDEAYFSLQAGDMHRVVATKLSGAPRIRQVLALTRPVLGLDVAAEGTLYLDQIDQPTEILRLDPSSGDVERFALSMDFRHVLPLTNDRFLVAPSVGGRDRLMVVAPPTAPVPFLVDTDEETRGPLAIVADDSIAFLIGPRTEQQLALASIGGRLQKRILIETGGVVTGLASSPDGTSLYYAADGVVYRVPSSGGISTPVSRGNELAVDPTNGDLVILRGGDVGQLVRVGASSGAETSIEVDGDWRVHGLDALMGNSVESAGRVVTRTLPPASWLFPVGILDSRQGGSIIPFLDPPDTDMYSAIWDHADRVVALAHPFRSELWRFRPAIAR